MKPPRRDGKTIPDSLEPPGPPATLRDRVLDRAGAALDRPEAPDLWNRIYASRPLRAAWAVTVLALIAANALLPGENRGGEKLWFTEENAGRLPELREVVDLPRLNEAYVSVDRIAYGRPTAATPAGSVRKEKNS
jgi:hypothetical protein